MGTIHQLTPPANAPTQSEEEIEELAQKEILESYGYFVKALNENGYSNQQILTASVVAIAHMASDVFNGDWGLGRKFRERMGGIFWDAYMNIGKMMGREANDPRKRKDEELN